MTPGPFRFEGREVQVLDGDTGRLGAFRAGVRTFSRHSSPTAAAGCTAGPASAELLRHGDRRPGRAVLHNPARPACASNAAGLASASTTFSSRISRTR